MVSPSRELFCVLFLIDYFGKILHRKRLQKIIFITNKKFGFDTSFNFVPYLYGPYSFDLDQFVKKLVLDGLVNENVTLSNIKEYSYVITPLGKTILNDMKNNTDLQSIDKLIDSAKFCSNKTTPEIVSISKKIISSC